MLWYVNYISIFFFFKDPGLFLHHWTLADPVTNSDQQNAVDVTL